MARRMAENAGAIRALVQGVTDQQARWKPDPTSWSVLEVVCHLLDEERSDFRVRLDLTLHRSGEPWPGINPEGWVTEQRYNEQDLPASLAAFLQEREASIAWLQALTRPDWAATYNAPWGPIAAGDLMAAWVAHDLLHTRQLVELRWALTQAELEPHSVEYAGKW
ncbi:MAG: DinB family protein [Chloroflexi bacterium]|nr:MAG: DinB family protein [Chloroflexota bacterium]